MGYCPTDSPEAREVCLVIRHSHGKLMMTPPWVGGVSLRGRVYRAGHVANGQDLNKLFTMQQLIPNLTMQGQMLRGQERGMES